MVNLPPFEPALKREVADLAAAGDLTALAERMAQVTISEGGDWRYRRGSIVGQLDSLPEDARVELALMFFQRMMEQTDPDLTTDFYHLGERLMRKVSLDLSPEIAARFMAWIAECGGEWAEDELAIVTRVLLKHGYQFRGEEVAVIRRTSLATYSDGKLRDVVKHLTRPPVNPGEEWADRVLADLPGLGEGWEELVVHAATATTAKPSAKWESAARARLERVGADAARPPLLDWLALAGRPRPVALRRPAFHGTTEDPVDSYNATVLRGLAWTLSLLPPHADTARELAALAERCLRKVPGIGPRSPKVANAAVWALSTMEGNAALAQLARLATRITFKGTLKEVNAALDRRAAALGLSRDEVEELAVPAYLLTEVGRREDVLGDVTAVTEVVAGRAVLGWRNAAGKEVKTIPAAVKRDHAEELAELRAAVKDVDKMLTAQAERLDRQFLARREWTVAAWRDRYLDHPLVGVLARRLIWLVDGVPCGYADGSLRTVDGSPVTPDDSATVTLWHPIGRDVAEAMAWREWIERYGVTQPFKQAHREVYVLTAAEERTGVYSNRFAAHVLRQHQFHALAAARGWNNKLRLMVDDTYPPATRDLPAWGLRAEYWIEGIGDDWGADTNESGAYLRVATDQVRFYPVAAPANWAHASGGRYEMWLPPDANPTEPLPLDQIPALVLSEVMRDVDLFVGVASVGNDPNWQDGGPEGRFRDYWASYSFGELSATAQTRRDLLARLIPRLAIADRCTVDGRFLVVRGDLREYKIHLGSGNILMAPNDEYLCIVPKAGAETGTKGVFLPFEGDRTLAVVLSKAMMLARDTAITDPTITSQIRRARG